MAQLDEKTSRYLALFGLAPGFTREELQRSYRTLAKLNHPDLNAGPASQMRMVLVNDGYDCLGKIADQIDQTPQIPRTEDRPYSLYRKGFDSLMRAFDLYYTEGASARSGRMELFLSELRSAKSDLARVIREFPESTWTGDAIDKVMSINVWLGE